MMDITLVIPSQQWGEGKPQAKIRISKGRSWRGRKVDFIVGKKLVTLTMDKDDLRKFANQMVALVNSREGLEP
jgi:hypothetical protein